MKIKGAYDSKSKTIETIYGEVYEIEIKRVEVSDNEHSNRFMAKMIDEYYDDISGKSFKFIIFGSNSGTSNGVTNIEGTLAKNYSEACDIYLEAISEDM